MRVALLSFAFRPSLGGIERVSEILEQGLSKAGHEVRVATMSTGPAEPGVLRQPSALELMSLLRWSDVVLESNVSIRLSWPCILGLARRPRLTVLHTPIGVHGGNRQKWLDRAKMRLLPRRSTYTVADWLGAELPFRTEFMPNPFDPSEYLDSGDERRSGVLFVGRLTRAKGLDVLIEALSTIDGPPQLTVVGDGPDYQEVHADARSRGLDVHFVGALPPAEVAKQMKKAAVLCIPSISEPPEVFPLVALEGLAAGCRIVASDCGGLPEAVSGHGLVVPERSPSRLALALSEALSAGPIAPDERIARRGYLQRFRSDEVISTYARVIEELVQR
ncbi:glycosyltransferase family 4 protein [Microbacterium hydrothermale]|uniref:glycosyltransferase family 4 protein n=1 Tax=Microbacterium hydrothermale TaxID=857427 RepID=UPI0010A7F5C6|nr:glycosyltransferase family 4 protein [Microbacterium hydrothermale]